MDVSYEVGSAKRRKDKENTNRETDKKRTLRYDWQQTDSEVTIIVFIGQGIDISQVKLHFTETSCLVRLPDGRKWECKLYRPIVDEGNGIQQKGSKLIIKMIKKVPEHWSQLEAGDSNCQTSAHVATTFLPFEIQRMKHDWYEKANDETVFCIHVYVRNIKKESLNVMFEETTLTVKFQTSDSSFHQMNSPSNENTMFLWKVALKEAIKPKECTFKLTSTSLEITLKKKVAQRWGSLEASIGSAPKVPNNIWMPAKSSGGIPLDSPEKQSASKNSEKEHRRESPHRCRRSPSQGKDDGTKSGSVRLNLGPKPEPIYPSTGSGVIKKPTCMVSPLSKSKQQSQMVSPGLTGLDNLGNTCFMNSVLQCLANTCEFRDFFLSGLFQSEINTENPLGMGGKLAVAFAVLLKVLWSGTQSSYAPSKLKTLIGMKANQFTGFAQHDAQEFMAFLLDGLHEDLNRIKNKPYIENIDSDGRPDKVVADESWRIYKQRNDSIVVDIFQGQYKSKLVCPVCNKVSITFDPFLYLSVPLPKKQRALPVFYFSKDPSRRPIKYVIMLPQDATVDDLKDKVSHRTGVSSADLRVFEVYKNKIHKNFGKGASLSSVTSSDMIFVFEVLNERLTGEPVVEVTVVQRITMPWPVTRCSYCGRDCPPSGSKLRRCTNCYRAGYCDQTCQKNHWVQHKSHCKLTPELVGCPFIISLPESKATFSTLCHQMEAYSRYSVDVFQPPLQLPVSNKGSASCTSTNSLSEKLDNGRKSDFDNSGSGIGSMSIFDSSSSGIGSMSHSSCTHSTDSEDLSVCETDSFRSEPTCSFDNQGSNVAACSENLQLASKSASDFHTKFENYEGSNTDDCKESLTREKGAEDEKDHTLIASNCDPCSVEDCGLLQDVAPLEGKNEPLIRVVFGKQQEQCVKSMPPLFNIHAVNLYGHTLPGTAGEPFKDKGEEPLNLSSHTSLAMDWKNNEKKQSYVLVQSKELEHDYDDQDTDFIKTEQSEVTLGQCLQWFTEPEILAPQEAWYCPSCQDHREATKQLSLWRLPIVLIIQLKRFSFKNLIWRDKIDKMVDFPVRGLDLSPYFCGSLPGDPPIYDLFAVINHHGGILGGHYTAYARCVNAQNMRRNDVDWRLFDDSRVMYVSESNVVTKSAYMLFYRQRGVPFTPTPTVIAHLTRSTSKEQKQKENLLDLELANVMDSNILSYLGEEPTEMDTVD